MQNIRNFKNNNHMLNRNIGRNNRNSFISPNHSALEYIFCVLRVQVCRYSEWTRPIIVDMTDLARCAELDPFNFTTRVCADGVVLKHLLANPDNIWLLQHCINGSQPGEPLGFNLFEQCQYASWGLSLPDQDLMALCWK